MSDVPFRLRPRTAPPGFPPDVAPNEVIYASHINAVRDAAALWPGDVNGQGHILTNVSLGAGVTLPAHAHAAADTTSGVFAAARLGSGVADDTVYLRGDGTWQPGGMGEEGPAGPPGPPGPAGIPLVVNDEVIGEASSGGSISSLSVAEFDAATSDGTVQGGLSAVFLSDGLYQCLWNGLMWEYYHAGQMARRPVNADFSWLNQSTSSVDTSRGGVYLLQPAAATQFLAIRKKTSPATPYTITVKLIPNIHPTINLGIGMLIGDGTKQHTFGITYGSGTSLNLVAEKWNSPTSWQSAYISIEYNAMGWLYLWLRMQDNGTSRICSVSTDGFNFRAVHTIGRTDFLTGSQVGFYCKAQNAIEAAGVMLVSWQES